MTLGVFFPYRLAIAAESFSRRLVEVYQREYGLSREEWRLLFLLASSDRRTSLELAKLTSLLKFQVSRAADRLESKGLIRRATAKSDRRLRVYACTRKGRDLFQTVLPLVNSRAEAILDAMSGADRAALKRGVEALLAAIEATSPSDPSSSDEETSGSEVD